MAIERKMTTEERAEITVILCRFLTILDYGIVRALNGIDAVLARRESESPAAKYAIYSEVYAALNGLPPGPEALALWNGWVKEHEK
jgi:hypothetical protein